MRRAAKIDGNHNEIVDALRAAGCSVLSLAAVGKGAPDLLVGRAGRNFLLEVKDGALPPSRRVLTLLESHFVRSWRGQVRVVESVNDALRALAE